MRAGAGEADRHYRDGLAAFQAGAPDRAEACFRAVLAIAPRRPDALMMLGIARAQRGDPHGALAAFDEAVAAAPRDPAGQINRAAVLDALGRRDEALLALDRALTLDARATGAWFNRATILNALGRPAEALEAADRALALDPGHDGARLHRALALIATGEAEPAFKVLRQLCTTRPTDPEPHYHEGRALEALGRFAEALASYDRALALGPSPSRAASLDNRGIVLMRLGREDEALESFSASLALDPGSLSTRLNRANALYQLWRDEAALSDLDAIAVHEAAPAGAWLLRGRVLLRLKRPGEAEASIARALAREPTTLAARIARAECRLATGRPALALGDLDGVLAEAPGDRDAAFMRLFTLAALGRTEAALDAIDEVLRTRPDDTDLLGLRGALLDRRGRHDEAAALFDRVLAAAPEQARVQLYRAMARLRQGDFQAGWPAYEWRWDRRNQPNAPVRAFVAPRWQGDVPIAGRTVLLHWEQGLGDTIQFSRYAAQAGAAGARVILEVQAPLRRLLAAQDWAGTVTAHGEPIPPHDLHCPLMSLPLAFRTDLASIPANPVWSVPPVADTGFRAALARRRRPLVGLVWSGKPSHSEDWSRSIPLAALRPLIDVPAGFVSLQKDTRPDDQAALDTMDILPLAPWLGDFADTAAIVAELDLVISVDTAVAHLAGALAKPVWLLLPAIAEWRWLVGRDDSPWYPSMRLFRQARRGDWEALATRVAAALDDHIRQF